MSKGRDAVVSVRISTNEQDRLRQVAETRGMSVSELVRSAALREAGEDAAGAITITTSPTSRSSQIEQGIFWDAPPGAEVTGSTITL